MDGTTAAIRFPPLNPVAFEFGPVAVRWYGLAYLAGFVAAYLLLRRFIRTGRLRISADVLSDLLGWLVLGVMLGGRLGWWLFYHRGGGADEPWWEPLALWRGGMSFHGGLLGVIFALALWTWRNRASFWNIADAAALVAPIGIFLGRLANFVNAELVGRKTNVPWGIVFPGDDFPRHPSQLYEALLEGPLLLLILWLASRRRALPDGRVAGLFVALYATFRFAAEFTRQPDPQLGFVLFGWVTMGQLLSLAILAAGLSVLVHRRRTIDGPAWALSSRDTGSSGRHAGSLNVAVIGSDSHPGRAS